MLSANNFGLISPFLGWVLLLRILYVTFTAIKPMTKLRVAIKDIHRAIVLTTYIDISEGIGEGIGEAKERRGLRTVRVRGEREERGERGEREID
jgi:hypothetical protein